MVMGRSLFCFGPVSSSAKRGGEFDYSEDPSSIHALQAYAWTWLTTLQEPQPSPQLPALSFCKLTSRSQESYVPLTVLVCSHNSCLLCGWWSQNLSSKPAHF